MKGSRLSKNFAKKLYRLTYSRVWNVRPLGSFLCVSACYDSNVGPSRYKLDALTN